MKRVLNQEIRDGWELQCARYQSMKGKVLKVLEHPDSTEEQMLQAALHLRRARLVLERVRASLVEKFPYYTITTKGIAVRISRTRTTH